MKTIKMAAWDCSVTFEVDEDVLKQSDLKDMHEFWMGHKSTLREFGGNMLYAVLSKVAKVAIHVQFENDYNLRGVIKAFDWKDGGGVEGYTPMCGSHGISIVAMEELNVGDFKAKEYV